ncbi:MAG: hypothetical protein Q4G60_10540, partial [bacterium]|nr:hypothetical protein [bacterium]
LPEYQGMGYAKLALMLTLPDSINQELTPEYTKTEIQAVKEEVEAEHQKTDLEVMMEGLNPDIEKIESDLDKAIYQLIHDNPDLLVEYIEISASAERIGMPIGDVDIYEMLAPNEQAMYSTRLQGIGRMFLSIKDQEHITLTNVRTNEKQTYYVQEARDYLQKMIGNMTGSRTEDIWMALFNEEFPVKEEPKAPETAKTLNAKPISEPKKSKVTKAPEKSAPKNEKPAKTLNAEAHKNEMENNAPKDIGQQPDQEAVGQQDTEETTEEAKGQQDSVCTGATISGEPVPATVENTDYEDKAAALARDISYFVANRKWTDVKYAADELAQTASMLMMTKEDN